MEDLDQKILRLLAADGRMSFTDLGKTTGLSTSAVHQRVKRLESRGLISGYTARLDHARLGRPVMAFVSVDAPPDVDVPVVAAEHPEIESCWSTAGAADGYLLKVRAASPAALDELLSLLRSKAGVTTSTTVVLTTAFEDRPIA